MPGVMVQPSANFTPVLMKGIKVDPQNPLKFEFIVDNGHSGLENEDLREEANKLIKYFLAVLTVPEEDLWVNLSPFGKDRIIPDKFGETEMGRDLLAQDYLLKQLTASMMYPEEELGKKFWDRIYAKAQMLYGTTEIPVNTFNKVWIVPEFADVYVNAGVAYVADSRLKVMLEKDYLAASKDEKRLADSGERLENDGVSQEIIRELIIPELEREVNSGKHFAPLRQIFHSMILATWFKKNLKNNILNQVYSDQSKIEGVNVDDKDIKEKIYQQYLEAYKKGAYNYIKEEIDPITNETIPRKYFSGGTIWPMTNIVFTHKVSSSTMQTTIDNTIGNSFTVSSGVNAVLEDGNLVQFQNLNQAAAPPMGLSATSLSPPLVDFTELDYFEETGYQQLRKLNLNPDDLALSLGVDPESYQENFKFIFWEGFLAHLGLRLHMYQPRSTEFKDLDAMLKEEQWKKLGDRVQLFQKNFDLKSPVEPDSVSIVNLPSVLSDYNETKVGSDSEVFKTFEAVLNVIRENGYLIISWYTEEDEGDGGETEANEEARTLKVIGEFERRGYTFQVMDEGRSPNHVHRIYQLTHKPKINNLIEEGLVDSQVSAPTVPPDSQTATSSPTQQPQGAALPIQMYNMDIISGLTIQVSDDIDESTALKIHRKASDILDDQWIDVIKMEEDFDFVVYDRYTHQLTVPPFFVESPNKITQDAVIVFDSRALVEDKVIDLAHVMERKGRLQNLTTKNDLLVSIDHELVENQKAVAIIAEKLVKAFGKKKLLSIRFHEELPVSVFDIFNHRLTLSRNDFENPDLFNVERLIFHRLLYSNLSREIKRTKIDFSKAIASSSTSTADNPENTPNIVDNDLDIDGIDNVLRQLVKKEKEALPSHVIDLIDAKEIPNLNTQSEKKPNLRLNDTRDILNVVPIFRETTRIDLNNHDELVKIDIYGKHKGNPGTILQLAERKYRANLAWYMLFARAPFDKRFKKLSAMLKKYDETGELMAEYEQLISSSASEATASSSLEDDHIASSKDRGRIQLERTRRMVGHLKKLKYHPKKIAVVIGDEGEDKRWGDYIINYRRIVTSLLKTWPDSLEQIEIVTNDPDIFLGVDRSKLKFTPLKEAFDKNERKEVDILIDISNPRRDADPYSSQILYQYITGFKWDYYKSLYNFQKEKQSYLRYERVIDKMLSFLGFELADKSEYLLRQSGLQNSNTIFINPIARNMHAISNAIKDDWVQSVVMLLNSGHRVVINGGPKDGSIVSLLSQTIYDQAKKIAGSNENLELRTFESRNDIVTFLNNEVRGLVTIDTGVFWAAQRIVGIPTVVITDEQASYVDKEIEEESFRAIEWQELVARPQIVIQKLNELGINASSPVKISAELRKLQRALSLEEKVGDRVRILRNVNGWSQNNLAKLIGETGDLISKWEKGKREVGLANVRRTIENMKGTVTVKSIYGKGTTVSIELPAASSSVGLFPRLAVNKLAGTIQYQRPKARFVIKPQNGNSDDPVDIVQVLEEVAKLVLGDNPFFVSVYGSGSYLPKQGGDPNYSMMKDLDLALYTQHEVTDMIISSLRSRFFLKLKDLGFDYDIFKLDDGKNRKFQLSVYPMDALIANVQSLEDTAAYNLAYLFKPTDIFYGDKELIDRTLSVYSVEQILNSWFYYYNSIWNGLNSDQEFLARDIKRIYLLAIMRGKEHSFQDVLEKYRELQEMTDERHWAHVHKEIHEEVLNIFESVKAELAPTNRDEIIEGFRQKFIVSSSPSRPIDGQFVLPTSSPVQPEHTHKVSLGANEGWQGKSPGVSLDQIIQGQIILGVWPTWRHEYGNLLTNYNIRWDNLVERKFENRLKRHSRDIFLPIESFMEMERIYDAPELGVSEKVDAIQKEIEKSLVALKRVRVSVADFLDGSKEAKAGMGIANDVQEFLERGFNDELHFSSIKLPKMISQVQSGLAVDYNFQFDHSHPDLTVKWDKLRMRQVFTNIIKNAIEAMPKGGDINIATQVKGQGKDQTVEMTISDTGPGIPEAILHHMFEPYKTTKDGGTGLGLFISRNYVEAHGGKMEITSVGQSGTTVTLELPLNASSSSISEHTFLSVGEQGMAASPIIYTQEEIIGTVRVNDGDTSQPLGLNIEYRNGQNEQLIPPRAQWIYQDNLYHSNDRNTALAVPFLSNHGGPISLAVKLPGAKPFYLINNSDRMEEYLPFIQYSADARTIAAIYKAREIGKGYKWQVKVYRINETKKAQWFTEEALRFYLFEKLKYRARITNVEFVGSHYEGKILIRYLDQSNNDQSLIFHMDEMIGAEKGIAEAFENSVALQYRQISIDKDLFEFVEEITHDAYRVYDPIYEGHEKRAKAVIYQKKDGGVFHLAVQLAGDKAITVVDETDFVTDLDFLTQGIKISSNGELMTIHFRNLEGGEFLRILETGRPKMDLITNAVGIQKPKVTKSDIVVLYKHKVWEKESWDRKWTIVKLGKKNEFIEETKLKLNIAKKIKEKTGQTLAEIVKIELKPFSQRTLRVIYRTAGSNTLRTFNYWIKTQRRSINVTLKGVQFYRRPADETKASLANILFDKTIDYPVEDFDVQFIFDRKVIKRQMSLINKKLPLRKYINFEVLNDLLLHAIDNAILHSYNNRDPKPSTIAIRQQIVEFPGYYSIRFINPFNNELSTHLNEKILDSTSPTTYIPDEYRDIVQHVDGGGGLAIMQKNLKKLAKKKLSTTEFNPSFSWSQDELGGNVTYELRIPKLSNTASSPIEALVEKLTQLGLEQGHLENRINTLEHYTNYTGRKLEDIIERTLEPDGHTTKEERIQVANLLVLLQVPRTLAINYFSTFREEILNVYQGSKGLEGDISLGYLYKDVKAVETRKNLLEKWFKPQEGQYVLDMLGGQGAFVMEYAKKYPQTFFTMIDANAGNMLKILNSLEQSELSPLDNIHLTLGDAEQEDIPAKQFQWVTLMDFPFYLLPDQKMEAIAQKMLLAMDQKNGKLLLVDTNEEREDKVIQDVAKSLDIVLTKSEDHQGLFGEQGHSTIVIFESKSEQQIQPLTAVSSPVMSAKELKYTPEVSLDRTSDVIGGIDFAPDKWNLNERGEPVMYDKVLDLETLQNLPIRGFVPVIYYIVPTNVPLLLGLVEEDDDVRDDERRLLTYLKD